MMISWKSSVKPQIQLQSKPHLKKVFENIHTIDFNEHRKIIAMNSAEREKVKFAKQVDPNNKKVEDWMGEG